SSFSSTHGPPTSSPFPYTTLFRSEHGAKDLLLGDGRIGKDVDKHRRFDEVTLRVQLALRRSAPRDEASLSFADLNVPEDLFPLADRKSTRLNSSHVKISYAVFCLK